MRKVYQYIIMYMLVGCALVSCDVHEFPDEPETRPFLLRLKYETDLPQWEYYYSTQAGRENGVFSRSVQSHGEMRYIIRAYPLKGGKRVSEQEAREFTFIRNVSEGYDCEFMLELAPGEYDLKVWSDLAEKAGDLSFHNATNFFEIHLQGKHQGNTDYRDAFRGTNSLWLAGGIQEHAPETVDILMQRPLAKYEFITTDLKEFLEIESALLQKKDKSATSGKTASRVNIDDYKVVLYYSGFMPNTYNMFIDKPVDSAMGVMFESKLTALNDTEASVGFDYVFVNGTESSVLVQVGLYDKEGKELSLTTPIRVPLKRSWHTLLRGTFLMQKATGGVGIDPDFEGDLNIEVK